MCVKSKIRKTRDMHREKPLKALQFANIILQIIEQSEIDIKIAFSGIINVIVPVARSLKLTSEQLNGILDSVKELYDTNLDN